jgi:predicted patatin/cPLA2 family phospholipase
MNSFRFLFFILAMFSANASKICNVLSLSGGGSFGAVEVGILDKIQLPKYDMITGISAGGLNAGFLSYFNSDKETMTAGVENLKNIYFGLTNASVYNHNMFQVSRTWSFYDTTPLSKTIEKELGKLTYTDGSKPTLIGSTNLNDGVLQIFQFEKQPKLRQKEILMATSAIPLVFPPQIIGGKYYVDGGAIANEIINGIEAYLNCDKYNITFITASERLQSVETINDLNDYVRRMAKVVMTDYNNELAEIIANPCATGSKGVIHYCYPDSKELENYSSLDFSFGKELYTIGYNHFKCEDFNYC